MEKSAASGIDHVMVIVDDAQKAGETFERLGFDVRPIGTHANKGTSNRLIMFDNTYLELMAVDYPTDENARYDSFNKMGGGINSLAMKGNAQAALNYWCAHGQSEREPVPFQRGVEIDGSLETASFQNGFLSEDREPGVGLFVCQHETPEFVYRSEWSKHRNTVTAVTGITIVTDNPAELRSKVDIAYGREGRSTVDGEALEVEVGASRISYVTENEFRSRFGNTSVPVGGDRVCAATMSMTVRDQEALVKVLGESGLPYLTVGSRVIVPAVAAENVVLEFQSVKG